VRGGLATHERIRGRLHYVTRSVYAHLLARALRDALVTRYSY